MAQGHGGAREGAGRKASWQHGETQTIRVPVALADQVLTYARQLDAGELKSTRNRGRKLIDAYDAADKHQDEDMARAMGRAIAQLEMELERMAESPKAKARREVLQHVVGILKGQA